MESETKKKRDNGYVKTYRRDLINLIDEIDKINRNFKLKPVDKNFQISEACNDVRHRLFSERA